jgi:hypothetical protein
LEWGCEASEYGCKTIKTGRCCKEFYGCEACKPPNCEQYGPWCVGAFHASNSSTTDKYGGGGSFNA